MMRMSWRALAVLLLLVLASPGAWAQRENDPDAEKFLRKALETTFAEQGHSFTLKITSNALDGESELTLRAEGTWDPSDQAAMLVRGRRAELREEISVFASGGKLVGRVKSGDDWVRLDRRESKNFALDHLMTDPRTLAEWGRTYVGAANWAGRKRLGEVACVGVVADLSSHALDALLAKLEILLELLPKEQFPGLMTTVWADPKTGLIHRLEFFAAFDVAKTGRFDPTGGEGEQESEDDWDWEEFSEEDELGPGSMLSSKRRADLLAERGQTYAITFSMRADLREFGEVEPVRIPQEARRLLAQD